MRNYENLNLSVIWSKYTPKLIFLIKQTYANVAASIIVN